MGDVPSVTDETLLRSALNGSQESWVELVGRYNTKGLRYLRGQVSDPDLGQDIMQNLWISLVQAVQREFPDHFGALFWTLLKRRLIDELRRRGRSREAAILDAPVDGGRSDGASLGDLVTDGVAVPEEAALQAEERGLLQQALEALPDHYRLVIQARQFEARSNRETAALLVSEGLVTDDGNVEKRVENYYYRGLKELRKQLISLGYATGGGAA